MISPPPTSAVTYGLILRGAPLRIGSQVVEEKILAFLPLDLKTDKKKKSLQEYDQKLEFALSRWDATALDAFKNTGLF